MKVFRSTAHRDRRIHNVEEAREMRDYTKSHAGHVHTPSKCTPFFDEIGFPPVSESSSMPPLQCHRYNATVTMPPLQCHNYNATVAMQIRPKWPEQDGTGRTSIVYIIGGLYHQIDSNRIKQCKHPRAFHNSPSAA